MTNRRNFLKNIIGLAAIGLVAKEAKADIPSYVEGGIVKDGALYDTWEELVKKELKGAKFSIKAEDFIVPVDRVLNRKERLS